MIYDLQKANMWKRISAFLFDGILLGILAVLFAWLLSMILRYDNWNNKLNDAYARYGEEYGVAFDISLSEYEALSPEEVEKLNAAYQAIGQDPEAVRAYNVLIQLTLLITSFSLLASCLCLELFIPNINVQNLSFCRCCCFSFLLSVLGSFGFVTTNEQA